MGKWNITTMHLVQYCLFHIAYNKIINKEPEYDDYGIGDFSKCRKINVYSLSSLNYSLLGIFFIHHPIPNKYFQSQMPLFLFIQGIVSYLSDSKYCTVPHWSHRVDYSLATYNTITGILVGLICYRLYYSYWIIGEGLLCRKIGSQYRKKSKVGKYMFFHTLWHYSLPCCAGWTVYNNHPLMDKINF